MANKVHAPQRYLTSKYSGMFISHSNAHQDIAITCIRYLSFSCFDLNITDDKVKENVLSGEYCLHLYAERNWMYHVNHAILELDRDSGSTESLASLLVKFVQLRLSEDPPQAANQAVPSEWRFLESLKSPPNVQRHLIDYCIFNSGEGLSKGILCESAPFIPIYIPCSMSYTVYQPTPLHYKNRRKSLDSILKISSLYLKSRMIRTNFKVYIETMVETYSSVLGYNASITSMGLTPRTREISI